MDLKGLKTCASFIFFAAGVTTVFQQINSSVRKIKARFFLKSARCATCNFTHILISNVFIN